jgi:hypothetical protein
MHSQQHNDRSPDCHQRSDVLGHMKRNDGGTPTKRVRRTLVLIHQTIQKAWYVVAMTAFVWLMRYVLDHIVTSESQLVGRRFGGPAGAPPVDIGCDVIAKTLDVNALAVGQLAGTPPSDLALLSVLTI